MFCERLKGTPLLVLPGDRGVRGDGNLSIWQMEVSLRQTLKRFRAWPSVLGKSHSRQWGGFMSSFPLLVLISDRTLLP